MKSFLLGLLIVFAWRAAGAQNYSQAPPRMDAKPQISQNEGAEKVKKKSPVSDPAEEKKKKVPVTEPPPRPIPEVEPHVPGQTPPPPPGSPPPHSM